MNLREAVAAAMFAREPVALAYETQGQLPVVAWERLPSYERDAWLHRAEAAIAAVREALKQEE